MQLLEIKKSLYKNKPLAKLVYIRKDGVLYSTTAFDQNVKQLSEAYQTINFLVPLSEIGEATFLQKMPAQLLIRYIIEKDPEY